MWITYPRELTIFTTNGKYIKKAINYKHGPVVQLVSTFDS